MHGISHTQLFAALATLGMSGFTAYFTWVIFSVAGSAGQAVASAFYRLMAGAFAILAVCCLIASHGDFSVIALMTGVIVGLLVGKRLGNRTARREVQAKMTRITALVSWAKGHFAELDKNEDDLLCSLDLIKYANGELGQADGDMVASLSQSLNDIGHPAGATRDQPGLIAPIVIDRTDLDSYIDRKKALWGTWAN